MSVKSLHLLTHACNSDTRSCSADGRPRGAVTPHGTLAATGEPLGCVGAPRPFTVPAGAPHLARVPGVCAQGGVQWLPRPHGHAPRPWTQGHLTHARRSFTAPTGVSPPTPPSPCLGGAPDSPACVSAFTGHPKSHWARARRHFGPRSRSFALQAGSTC